MKATVSGPIGMTGSQGALPVWADLMRSIDSVALHMAPPAGIEYHWIDPAGHLATRECAGAVAFPYIAGSQPAERAACAEPERGLGGFLQDLFN